MGMGYGEGVALAEIPFLTGRPPMNLAKTPVSSRRNASSMDFPVWGTGLQRTQSPPSCEAERSDGWVTPIPRIWSQSGSRREP